LGHRSSARAHTITRQLKYPLPMCVGREALGVLLGDVHPDLPRRRLDRAHGCASCVASRPALMTSERSPARSLENPSAIWLLAGFWVHRNSTLMLDISYLPRAGRSG